MRSVSGKTSDEVIVELADNLLNKLPDKFDITQGAKSLFQVILLAQVYIIQLFAAFLSNLRP